MDKCVFCENDDNICKVCTYINISGHKYCMNCGTHLETMVCLHGSMCKRCVQVVVIRALEEVTCDNKLAGIPSNYVDESRVSKARM